MRNPGSAAPFGAASRTHEMEEEYVTWPESLFPDKPLSAYTNREVGLEGEHYAAEYLMAMGYELIDRNWRCKYGEADLVMLDDDVAVLVEVKTRVDTPEGRDVDPSSAITEAKIERYRRILSAYITEYPAVRSARMDAVSVRLLPDKHAYLLHSVNAYNWDD